MKISIITVTLNNKAGLMRAIESVSSQTYKNVEHIIVDGGSTDGSIEAIKNLQFTIYNLVFISEADSGIYDAINKGIKLATGDVIGLLHSDDFYKDEFVLEKYADVFEQSGKQPAHSSLSSTENEREIKDFSVNFLLRNDNALPTTHYLQPTIEAVYSDLVYVRKKLKVSHRDDKPKSQKSKNEDIDHSKLKIEHSIIRYWKAHKIKKDYLTTSFSLLTTHHLLNGWMPPHPTLFIRKSIFDKYGLYRTDMKIAADYEMILRLFYKNKITTNYLPHTTYCMTMGGASNKSIKNIIQKSKEDYFAMKIHGFPIPVKTLIYKNCSKVTQFFKR